MTQESKEAFLRCFAAEAFGQLSEVKREKCDACRRGVTENRPHDFCERPNDDATVCACLPRLCESVCRVAVMEQFVDELRRIDEALENGIDLFRHVDAFEAVRMQPILQESVREMVLFLCHHHGH